MEAVGVRATAPPGVEAGKGNIPAETYHPFSPAIPATESAVEGPTRSMSIFVVEERLHNPAASNANTSREWRPAPSMNGPTYGCQGPPSMRYRIPATPLIASEASSVTVTFDTYQVLLPMVPIGLAKATGGVESIEKVFEWAGS